MVVAVAANDPSANIVYSKVMRGVPNDGFFSVTDAGVVNVLGNIDREAETTYDVQIQVRTLSFWLHSDSTTCSHAYACMS